MITRKAAAALAAGCTMVVHPASETPLLGARAGRARGTGGLPAGVFNVSPARPRPIVGELCADPVVRAVSFTGSTEIGKQLIASSARRP